jgi:plasmid stabilization system protein ParE
MIVKKLNINPQVYDDLQAIREYISQDDPAQSEKVVRKIYADIVSLADMPERGANLQNKVRQKTKYKYILTYKYATLYYIDKDTVYVTLVFHTAKDLSALKLIDPELSDNKQQDNC